jgi:para-nitrobenzyl esterase
MMRSRLALLALVLAALGVSIGAAPDAPAVVDAPAGSVRGTLVDGVRVFKGIPYALPPVGPQRWTPPVPVPRWGATRDATAFGPACVQPAPRAESIYAWTLPATSEDCLSLNIWAPAKARGAAVFVWIHGGALSSGAGSERLYDGTRLAQHGLVVVTINYRLGALGYLAHPALSAESPRHTSGNYGLLDQIAALRWVKANIGAFGGDAAKVTIAGESAGGLSVMYLLAAPEARGLFARAIAQSAYMISTPELRGSPFGDPAAETAGVYVAGKLGVSDLPALRALDAATVTNGAAASGWLPSGVVDGHVLTRQLVDTFDRGEQARVPVLAGFNTGEIRSLRALLPPPPADAAAYEARIRERYADLADAFLERYPASHIDESMLATTRDALYGWTAERLASRQASLGVPSFLYVFDHGYEPADGMGLHAFHASELPYVFGTADRTPAHWPPVPRTPVETRLSEAMLGYWAAFARDGAPSAKGQPTWRPYGAARAAMTFTDAPVPTVHPLPGMFELVEQVVCRRRTAGGVPWHWNVGVASPPLPPKADRCQ